MGPSGSAGGRELQKWLEGILAAHGVGVFGDLPYPGDDRAAGRHRLQVLVWDQEDGRLLLLPRDADELGLDPDGLRVSLAVRMATTPPWGLDAVVHTNPVTGRQHRLVDGSLRAGFPVDAFDVPAIPRWPTFGVRMHDDPAGPLPDLPRPAWSSSLPQQDELLATALSLQERMGLAPAA